MTSSAPRLRFGIIADPQYAAAEPDLRLDRYFTKSLDKLAEAVRRFNAEELDFVLTLGDVIDRGFENFDAVLSVYAGLRHQCLFLPGNHDFKVEAARLGEVHGRLGMAAPYYDLVRNGCRIVVIEGSDISLFAPPPGDPRRATAEEMLAVLRRAGAANAQTWNGGVGEAQLAWLSGRLALAEEAGETVIAMGHYPLFPHNEHNLWNAEAVAGLLVRSPAVAAYFCGHNHAGNYGELGGTHFVNFRGMVDTERENAFALVEVFDDRIDITGFGREPSRSLKLPVAARPGWP
ncbi:metallophosphoesterase [Ciceribacter thiooxidans]|uniref:Metallophosphoesterase n=1 Tax=Ciceribacter thiooxidans TaxID=1969821 RepID=A0ABV7I3G0_9HYPH|nr:metallophosphoesterase [Ciceribacter thiooxidans]